jgi:hypothetical protein
MPQLRGNEPILGLNMFKHPQTAHPKELDPSLIG